MSYSEFIPLSIPKNGTYFYDFCTKCQRERRHLVQFVECNSVKLTVKYVSTCWDCYNEACEYNAMNNELHLSSQGRDFFWIKFIWSIEHWNEFVTNSRVHSSNYPPHDPPLLDREKHKDFFR